MANQARQNNEMFTPNKRNSNVDHETLMVASQVTATPGESPRSDGSHGDVSNHQNPREEANSTNQITTVCQVATPKTPSFNQQSNVQGILTSPRN